MNESDEEKRKEKDMDESDEEKRRIWMKVMRR